MIYNRWVSPNGKHCWNGGNRTSPPDANALTTVIYTEGAESRVARLTGNWRAAALIRRTLAVQDIAQDATFHRVAWATVPSGPSRTVTF